MVILLLLLLLLLLMMMMMMMMMMMTMMDWYSSWQVPGREIRRPRARICLKFMSRTLLWGTESTLKSWTIWTSCSAIHVYTFVYSLQLYVYGM